MLQDKNGSITVFGGLSIAIFCVLCVMLLLWGCPSYNVYKSRKNGETELAQAQHSREVAVARAKMEAADMLAQADTIRAHGIAASNRIAGKSLEGNPAYLQWLFIDQLKDTKDQVIYIPSGQMGMPILEANRLVKSQMETEHKPVMKRKRKAFPRRAEELRKETERIYFAMLKLHCAGKPYKAIAIEASISVETVKIAFKLLKAKYEASNMAQLLTILYKEGKL